MKLTESQIENFAISLLEKKGYQYFYGPDIAPDAENAKKKILRVLCGKVLKKLFWCRF